VLTPCLQGYGGEEGLEDFFALGTMPVEVKTTRTDMGIIRIRKIRVKIVILLGEV